MYATCVRSWTFVYSFLMNFYFVTNAERFQEGDNALTLAAHVGSSESVRLLLDVGSKKNAKDYVRGLKRRSQFTFVSFVTRMRFIIFLSKRYFCRVQWTDWLFAVFMREPQCVHKALYRAAVGGHLECMRLLVEGGGDKNAQIVRFTVCQFSEFSMFTNAFRYQQRSFCDHVICHVFFTNNCAIGRICSTERRCCFTLFKTIARIACVSCCKAGLKKKSRIKYAV